MFNRLNTNGSVMRLIYVAGIARMSLVALLLLAVIFGAEQTSRAEAIGIVGAVLSTSVASDMSGNIFYLDTAHSQLYEVSNGGTQIQIPCCEGLATGLNQPRGVALDSQNNLYIADTGNNRIVKINSESQASIINLGLYRLLAPSGCADNYPAGPFGTATYTATLIATPTNGKPYSLGGFGITMAN